VTGEGIDVSGGDRTRCRGISDYRAATGKQFLRKRLIAFVLPAVVALLVGGSLLVAPPASADVLVSSPESRVCRGHAFHVGVVYQSYSGGPHRYRIDVYQPGGRRVFHAHGRVKRARDWRVWADRLGRYRVVYHASSSRGPWKRVFRVRSRRC